MRAHFSLGERPLLPQKASPPGTYRRRPNLDWDQAGQANFGFGQIQGHRIGGIDVRHVPGQIAGLEADNEVWRDVAGAGVHR